MREEIRGSVAEDTVVKADCSESGVQKIRDITSPRVRGSDFRSEGGLEQELNQIGSAEEPERKKPRVSEGFQKKTGRKSRDEARAKECDLERNYWIEFWNAETKRWICKLLFRRSHPSHFAQWFVFIVSMVQVSTHGLVP